MFVSGFTFVRNAVKYDYPIAEAIRSILPLCDEVIVAVGDSEDDTLSLVQSIDSPKIKIINTVWDDSLREGGRVLAVETDKALAAVSPLADWCLYIQGDEVLHEKDHANICQMMEKYKDDPATEGLLFHYKHFYGSYDYIGDSRTWYRHEVRIVKPLSGLRSYRDAQGFRIDDRKLNVRLVDACVYHYGWVKHPSFQLAKQKSFNKLWHSDETVEKMVIDKDAFDYGRIDSLKKFAGSHPQVILPRVKAMNWSFNFDPTLKKISFKEKLSRVIEKITGMRIGEYKNYRLINRPEAGKPIRLQSLF